MISDYDEYIRGYRAAIRIYGPCLDQALNELGQLRQAARDLTASSEKLRELNRAAIAKGLKQEQEIKALRAAVSRDTARIQIDNLTARIRDLEQQLAIYGNAWYEAKLALERTEAQLRACLTANRQADEEIAELKRVGAQFQRMYTDEFLKNIQVGSAVYIVYEPDTRPSA